MSLERHLWRTPLLGAIPNQRQPTPNGRRCRLTMESLNIGEHLGELKHRLKIAFLSYVGLLAIFMLAPAEPSKAITFTGTYVPFVAFFLATVKLDLLPAGWTLIANNLSEPLMVYLVASVILAGVFNGPIFAYETMKFITPA